MKNYLLAILAIGALTFVGCKEEEEKIDPLVGEWELVEMEITDTPSGFQNYQGVSDANVYGEVVYTLEFKADGSFERQLRFSSGRVNDDGTWERDGDEIDLDIDSDEGLPDNYVITEDVDNDEVQLSAEVIYKLLPDAVTDTAVIDSSAELEALYQQYGQSVTVTVLHYFEK